MTNNELLLAMSKMMDAKFYPLQRDLQVVKNEVQVVKNEMHVVKEEVQVIKADLQGVKEEVQAVKADLQGVKEEVQVMKADLQNVKDDVQGVKLNLQSVEFEIQKIKLFQENKIMPRLNTIESCYGDTYDRYRSYVEKMDAAFIDIDILKKVVSEHSRKLQKLA
ncbi:MAG: hypothetical protein K2N80_16665 [Lachnospiraceae bacterium]|nr:hypothetical protein [Lachnospiraceae bacterium]